MDPIEPWLDRKEIRRLADSLLAAPVRPEEPDDATYGAEFEGYDAPAAPPVPEAPPLSAMQAAARAVEGPVSAALEQQARQALALARERAERGGLLRSTEAGSDDDGTKPLPVVAPPPLEGGGEQVPQPPAVVARPAPDPVPERSSEPARRPGIRPEDLRKPMSGEERGPKAQPEVRHAPTPFVTRLKAFGNWLRQGLKSSAYFLTDRDGGILVDEVQSPKLHQVARTLAQASRTANRQAGAAAVGNLHIKISPENCLEVIPVTTRYGPMVLGIIVPKPIKPENVEIIARALQQVMDGPSGG